MRKLSVTIWHNVKETPSVRALTALAEGVFCISSEYSSQKKEKSARAVVYVLHNIATKNSAFLLYLFVQTPLTKLSKHGIIINKE